MPYDDITQPVRRTPPTKAVRPQAEPPAAVEPSAPPASQPVSAVPAPQPILSPQPMQAQQPTQQPPRMQPADRNTNPPTQRAPRNDPPPAVEPAEVEPLNQFMLPIAALGLFLSCCIIGGVINAVLEFGYIHPKIEEYKKARQKVPSTTRATQIINWIGVGLGALTLVWFLLYCFYKTISSS
jgi:hypothetical protein